VVILHREVLDRTDCDNPRIVDEDVNRSVVCNGTLTEISRLLAVAEVASNRKNGGAMFDQVSLCAAEFVFIAGTDDQLRSFLGELTRKYEAKSPGAASDENRFPTEIKVAAPLEKGFRE